MFWTKSEVRHGLDPRLRRLTAKQAASCNNPPDYSASRSSDDRHQDPSHPLISRCPPVILIHRPSSSARSVVSKNQPHHPDHCGTRINLIHG
ncbi:MAG: hypothetical protein KGQ39_07735 [Bacteroidetes bacterium]|nr:hypothetical protein [Bacteroidota bacterium]